MLAPLLVALATPAAHADNPSPGPGIYNSFTHERLRIPMRDGVTLSADLYRPANASGTLTAVPVIVQLSPYHLIAKATDRNETDLPDGFARTFVRRGYAFAVVDVRGTYNSGGCWDYGGLKERQDGYDVVEWLGTRPWSNGKVAMIGASYDGTTANAAAIEQPPHLATIVPISAISRWWGYAYQQAARATSSGDRVDLDPPSDTPADFMFAYGVVPPPDADRIDDPNSFTARLTPCDRREQTRKGYLDPTYDEFWKERDYLQYADKVQVPVLVAHGLLDTNVKTWEGTDWFAALQVPKVLVLGQWAHALPTLSGWNIMLNRWMDRWLYDVGNVSDLLGVHVQGNTGGVRRQESWGTGPIESLPLGTGTARFRDDGVTPETLLVTGIGEGSSWVRIAVGTPSGRIEGNPALRLRFTPDMPTAHLFALLCAVPEDGSCKPISRAFGNALYRFGYSSPQVLLPDEPTYMRLEFLDTDHQLAPGERLELRIAGSSPTWFVSDTLRTRITIDLSLSKLEIPIGV